MIPKIVKVKNRHLPERPGVYFMKDAAGEILYVGKAANLRRRVESYFSRPHDHRIQKLVANIRRIDYEETGSAIEALIREAELIKQLQPPYNVLEKDDTSFLYIEIAVKDDEGKRLAYPAVVLARGKDPARGRRFGPFTAPSHAREALRIIRRIFSFSTHVAFPTPTRTMKRPCFDYQIGLCPGTCIGVVTKREYAKTIRHLTLFFEGKKQRIVRSLEREMNMASKKLDFERAARLRGQIFALQHIQDVALIADTPLGNPGVTVREPFRIEGYDISNISGTSSVGSMVVFVDGVAAKQEYRKFKIKTVTGSNDVAMLKEVLSRRLNHKEWSLPSLILVDGGIGQVNAMRTVLARRNLRRVPVVGLAKGPERKRNDVVGRVPAGVDLTTLIKVRDEAHRFAVRYHTRLRGARIFL